MIKSILSVGLLLISSVAFSQETVYKYWVELTDKNNNGYSIDKPEQYLSKRAIERRQKQAIKITYEDLPITAAYRDGINAAGVQVLYSSRWFNAVAVRTTDSNLMRKVRALPYVRSTRLLYNKVEITGSKTNDAAAMMEFLMSMGGKSKPSDNSPYGFGYNQINQLNGIELHNKGYKGEGMVIAILDAGFYKMNEIATFDHLRNEGRLLGTFDVVMQDTMVYEDDMHGMNVLSCMASNTPGKMIGTAPNASYWLIRTEDNHSENPIEEANWVAGAEFADSVGADVINSSLGYTSYDDPSMSYTYKDLNGSSLISRAAVICARKGMILCNAAGNEGADRWKHVGVPADADSIITVGGVDSQGDHASFSSYGPTSDGRIKPTICAKALETTVASSKDKFYPSQGTSFASPVMCGMVACLWQANPTKTNMEIIDALIKSGNNFSHPDNTYGYGIPDLGLANRILGGDKSFDYAGSRLLTEIPTEYTTDGFVLQYYSDKDQSMEISILDSKGRTVRRVNYSLTKGQFLFYPLKDLPISKKGITLQIKTGEEIKTYKLEYRKKDE